MSPKLHKYIIDSEICICIPIEVDKNYLHTGLAKTLFL